MAHLEVKPRTRSNWWIWLIIVIVILAAAYYIWSNYTGNSRSIVNTSNSSKTDQAAARTAK